MIIKLNSQVQSILWLNKKGADGKNLSQKQAV